MPLTFLEAVRHGTSDLLGQQVDAGGQGGQVGSWDVHGGWSGCPVSGWGVGPGGERDGWRQRRKLRAFSCCGRHDGARGRGKKRRRILWGDMHGGRTKREARGALPGRQGVKPPQVWSRSRGDQRGAEGGLSRGERGQGVRERAGGFRSRRREAGQVVTASRAKLASCLQISPPEALLGSSYHGLVE